MIRFVLALVLALWASSAFAQSTVSVIGPVTPGDCPEFFSITQLQDSNVPCIAVGGVTSVTAQGGMTQVGTTGPVRLNGAPSHVNLLRGNSGISALAWWGVCSQPSGESCTVPTTVGVKNWLLDGLLVIPTGAAVVSTTLSPVTSVFPNPLTIYGFTVTGAASNTDVTLSWVVEQIDAGRCSNWTCTFQFTWYNDIGSSVTPMLETKSPTSGADNWAGGATEDIASTALQVCPNHTVCTESYTWNVSTLARWGYEINVDFGPLSSNSKQIDLEGGFDFRVTPNETCAGTAPPCIQNNPPPPEVWNWSTDQAAGSAYFVAWGGSSLQNGSINNPAVYDPNTGEPTVTMNMPFQLDYAQPATIAISSQTGLGVPNAGNPSTAVSFSVPGGIQSLFYMHITPTNAFSGTSYATQVVLLGNTFIYFDSNIYGSW